MSLIHVNSFLTKANSFYTSVRKQTIMAAAQRLLQESYRD